jgi:hypothetical protein
MKSVVALQFFTVALAGSLLFSGNMSFAKSKKNSLPVKTSAPTAIGGENDAPAYLTLEAPETYIAPTDSLNQWWTQMSVQSYRPSGEFNGPQSAQNFSQAGNTLLPRLDLGASRKLDSDWSGRLSLGASWIRQNLTVNGPVSNVDSQLTSFIWSLRPGITYQQGRWLTSGIFELGEVQLIQDSSSVSNSIRRKATLAGAGVEIARPIVTDWSVTGSLFSRKSSDETNTGVSPLSLEVGVRTQW